MTQKIIRISIYISLLLFLNPQLSFARVKSPKSFRVIAPLEKAEGIQLMWDFKQKNPLGYKVQVERSEGDNEFESIAETSLEIGEHIDSIESLLFEVPYSYRIRTLSPEGETSKWVKVKSVSIPKPQYSRIESFDIALASNSPAIQISWEGDYPGNPQVMVERRESLTDFSTVGSIEEEEGLFLNGGVQNGIQYFYRLYVAEDVGGARSDYSEEREITFYSERHVALVGVDRKLEKEPQGDQILISWSPQLYYREKDDFGNFLKPESRLVAIERKVNDEDYVSLVTLEESDGSFRDADLVMGNESLGSDGGYLVKGNRYSYRLRFVGQNSIYPIDWQELEPVDYGVKRYNWIEILHKRLPEKTAFHFSWEDPNLEENPTLFVERKRGSGEYEELIRVLESKLEFVDFGIQVDQRYSYRFTWLGKGDFVDSESYEIKGISLLPPVLKLPQAIKAKLIQEGTDFSLVQISWQINEEEDGDPTLEIQRSSNSRDFVKIGEVSASEKSFRDAKVTHIGGSRRVQGGKEILLNVYRYRVKCLGNDEVADSNWYETKDMVVIGPA